MNRLDQCPGCHAERSEACLCQSSQALRGVYPERSKWAQGDSESAGHVLPELVSGRQIPAIADSVKN